MAECSQESIISLKQHHLTGTTSRGGEMTDLIIIPVTSNIPRLDIRTPKQTAQSRLLWGESWSRRSQETLARDYTFQIIVKLDLEFKRSSRPSKKRLSEFQIKPLRSSRWLNDTYC